MAGPPLRKDPPIVIIQRLYFLNFKKILSDLNVYFRLVIQIRYSTYVFNEPYAKNELRMTEYLNNFKID